MAAEQTPFFIGPNQRQTFDSSAVLTRYPVPILQRNPANSWEAGAVFNASVLYDPATGLHQVFYRATNDRHHAIPGKYRSSIGYGTSLDGIHFDRRPTPLIQADQKYEYDKEPKDGLGCEDPRVTKFGDEYFIFYTAVQGPFNKEGTDLIVKRDRIALATTTDLENIDKHGVIGPDVTSKAATLFPERINGKYIMLYTFRSDSPQSSIMIAEFDNLDEVKNSREALADNAAHFSENALFPAPVGAHRGPEVGATPVRTRDGWLVIYTGANDTKKDLWTIDAALLDINDPRHVIAHTTRSLLTPETEDETIGYVKNVTFPSAAIVYPGTEDNDISVYYGSGDKVVSLARGKLSRLMGCLEEVSRF